MPILVVLRLKECVTECDRLNTLHVDIRNKLRVNVEEDWHVDRLTSIQPLLLETKALDLTEVRRYLSWCHRVCCDTDDVLV